QQNIFLTLSIYETPYFYHTNKEQNLECKQQSIEFEKTIQTNSIESTTIDTNIEDSVIKLPKKRAISSLATIEKSEENTFTARLPF
ncbi:hypothetical protein, partial [Pseudomonas sp. FW305-BF6]|uniref:hypothetical protein n=1 Tax=Pseudomonas sp. FW305-BF6 TaxID=2070673 RepID=UPI001304B75B